MTRQHISRRPAATVVELAVVAPILILILFGLIIGGLGVFRYHQIACLAREAARHACVHGLDYQRETGQPAATQDSIKQDVVLANAAGLTPSRLTCTVTWDKSNIPQEMLPDKTVRTNIVTVTVSYDWIPEGLFGRVTLSSTSKMPMSY
jgi:Flp pilus assembly protein TadG